VSGSCEHWHESLGSVRRSEISSPAEGLLSAEERMHFMESTTAESHLYLKQEVAEISHNNIQSVNFSVNKIFLALSVVTIG
jgi:hypothetical protein